LKRSPIQLHTAIHYDLTFEITMEITSMIHKYRYIYNHGCIVIIPLFNMDPIEICAIQLNIQTVSYCQIFNLNIITTIFRLGNHMLYFHSTSYHVSRLRLEVSTISLLSIILRRIGMSYLL